MERLQGVTIEEAKDFIPDEDVLRVVINSGEPVLRVSGSVTIPKPKDDELVELEVALRECERVGVFKK